MCHSGSTCHTPLRLTVGFVVLPFPIGRKNEKKSSKCLSPNLYAMQVMQKWVQMRYCSNTLCTVFLQATNTYSVWHTQRCVDSPEPAQRETLFMWMIFSFSGWCFWILGISYVSWLADTLLSLLPHEKGQASVTSANKTSTGPCCSRHKPLPSLWPKAWPVLISFLTLQSFMTLPHVIIAPGEAMLPWNESGRERLIREWRREKDKKEEKEMRVETGKWALNVKILKSHHRS